MKAMRVQLKLRKFNGDFPVLLFEDFQSHYIHVLTCLHYRIEDVAEQFHCPEFNGKSLILEFFFNLSWSQERN